MEYIVNLETEFYDRVNYKSYKYEFTNFNYELKRFNSLEQAIEYIKNYKLEYEFSRTALYVDYLTLCDSNENFEDYEMYNRGYDLEELAEQEEITFK